MSHVPLFTVARVFALTPLALVGSSCASSHADPATTSPATEEPSGDWTNWKGDAGRTGVADAGPTGDPVELWRVQTDRSCYPPPVVVAGVVFAGCDDGVYALDAATGAERWRFFGVVGDVTASDGLVYVSTPGQLRALDAATGEERWRERVDGFSPVVDDGVLVIGTGDGFLLGLDAQTGAERWRYQVSTQGAVHNPALSGGIAYASGEAAGFVAVDATTGELVWHGDTGDDQTATAVVAEGIAYVGGSPHNPVGHLYAFDALTGELLWTRDQPLFSPTVRDGVGYSGGVSGTVDAFDTEDGTPRWQADIGGVVLNVALAGDLLYTVSDGPNEIAALDAATGDPLWSFPVDGRIDYGISVDDGVIYVSTMLGSIYAISGIDQAAPP